VRVVLDDPLRNLMMILFDLVRDERRNATLAWRTGFRDERCGHGISPVK
jgi:hypothetical protein